MKKISTIQCKQRAWKIEVHIAKSTSIKMFDFLGTGDRYHFQGFTYLIMVVVVNVPINRPNHFAWCTRSSLDRLVGISSVRRRFQLAILPRQSDILPQIVPLVTQDTAYSIFS